MSEVGGKCASFVGGAESGVSLVGGWSGCGRVLWCRDGRGKCVKFRKTTVCVRTTRDREEVKSGQICHRVRFKIRIN